LVLGRLRIMSCDGVIGEALDAFGITAGSEILERADANVAGGYTSQHRARQRGFAHDVLAGDGGRERARGRNAERRHRFADDIFAQDGAERRAAVATARERRRAGALELDVAADAVDVDHLTEQDGAAIAELWHEMAELVAGIGHGDRITAEGTTS